MSTWLPTWLWSSPPPPPPPTRDVRATLSSTIARLEASNGELTSLRDAAQRHAASAEAAGDARAFNGAMREFKRLDRQIKSQSAQIAKSQTTLDTLAALQQQESSRRVLDASTAALESSHRPEDARAILASGRRYQLAQQKADNFNQVMDRAYGLDASDSEAEDEFDDELLEAFKRMQPPSSEPAMPVAAVAAKKKKKEPMSAEAFF